MNRDAYFENLVFGSWTKDWTSAGGGFSSEKLSTDFNHQCVGNGFGELLDKGDTGGVKRDFYPSELPGGICEGSREKIFHALF